MRAEIKKILPPDLEWEGDGTIEVPPWAFTPDAWSFAFLRGLHEVSPTLSDLDVWEVGVGTGLNQLLLAKWSGAHRLYYSDYDPRCTELTANNLYQITDERFVPLFGRWDLVTQVEQQMNPPQVDIIVACIPQVPTNETDLSKDDNLAHYYNPINYGEASLHAVGLGLNEALLKRAHSVLRKNGRVVLNLSGRPSLPRLEKMYHDCGFIPRVVHAEMIPQCPGTSLASLAAMEGSNQEFEFFSDATGHKRINAQMAEKRRLEGLELYHKIYVIAGRANT
jgi:methylase of polypeptide subunit release factors